MELFIHTSFSQAQKNQYYNVESVLMAYDC